MQGALRCSPLRVDGAQPNSRRFAEHVFGLVRYAEETQWRSSSGRFSGPCDFTKEQELTCR